MIYNKIHWNLDLKSISVYKLRLSSDPTILKSRHIEYSYNTMSTINSDGDAFLAIKEPSRLKYFKAWNEFKVFTKFMIFSHIFSYFIICCRLGPATEESWSPVIHLRRRSVAISSFSERRAWLRPQCGLFIVCLIWCASSSTTFRWRSTRGWLLCSNLLIRMLRRRWRLSPKISSIYLWAVRTSRVHIGSWER